MEIYDYTTLDCVEEGDQIAYTNDEGADDLIEVTKVIDSGESILIKGYSHTTGDNETYILSPDTKVGLWSV